MRECEGELGIFTNQNSTLLRGKAMSGMFHHPPSHLHEKQKWCRG